MNPPLTNRQPAHVVTFLLAAALSVLALCGWKLLLPEQPQEPARPLVATHPVTKSAKVDRASDQVTVRVPVVKSDVRKCQALGPAAPHPIWAVDSASSCGLGEVGWDARGITDWQRFAQGEYSGHARTTHVPEYRLRPGDQLSFAYRRTRSPLGRSYELQIGDEIQIESLTAGRGPATRQRGDQQAQSNDSLNRILVIQPDGSISLPLVGEVRAAGRSVQSLRDELEETFKQYLRVPAITVTPVTVNTRLEDLIESVDARAAIGGLTFPVTVTPAGAIRLPGIGRVFVQSLTADEVKMEVDARYDAAIPGVEVTPVLEVPAPRFIYVLGEVQTPGQFQIQTPTTVMQAMALAGGWNVGANIRQIVVFRRGDDWRLMATMLDLKGALYGKRPTPADDIWLNDSDIVLIPKSPIKILDEFIELAFTRGLYAAIPLEIIWGQGFSSVSAISSSSF